LLNHRKGGIKYPALYLSLIFIPLFITGCSFKPIEPTYKEEDIPRIVKQICKDEYNLEITTKRTPTTLWIYAPFSKILHKDYGVKEDKIFDEEMIDKLRNILITIGRVLISSDNTPEFFALVASDINLGLDYIIIENVLDMKKSYAGFIPETEANRRYVIDLKIAPEAIGDTMGTHLKTYNIKLPDFLAKQIAQRIGAQFQVDERKKYFKVEKSEGKFSNDTFTFEYSIEEIAKPAKEIDIQKEISNIIAYCLNTYEFKDFLLVEIKNAFTGEKSVYSRLALKDFL
jgi:hypothetical protein